MRGWRIDRVFRYSPKRAPRPLALPPSRLLPDAVREIDNPPEKTLSQWTSHYEAFFRASAR
jgi:hypothetical protein